MSKGPLHGLTVAEQLSYHMVQHLSSKMEITPTTILKAAMESDRGMFVLHQLDLDQKAILSTIAEHPIGCSLDTCLNWLVEAVKDLQTERLDSTATIYAFLTHIEELTALVFKADLSPGSKKRAPGRGFPFLSARTQTPFPKPGSPGPDH